MSEQCHKSLSEYIRQGSIELGRGNIISRIDIENHPGPYPIYSSSAQGDGKFGEYAKFMFDEELISWSIDGGGSFFYRQKHKFSVTNVSGFLRIRSRNLSYKFLYYCLSQQHRSFVFDYTTKAHPSVIRSLYKIPDISYEEQSRIAQVLSTIDNQIDKTEALIAKYQQIKAGLMHDLFTRRGSWGIQPLGELVEVLDPNPSHRYPPDQDYGVPICSTENFSGEDDFDISFAKFIPMYSWNDQNARCRFHPDDVIFARKGRIGLARRYGDQPKAFSHTVVTLKTKSADLNQRWLLWLMRSWAFMAEIERTMNTNLGVPTLGIAFIQGIQVAVPPVPFQEDAALRLDGIATALRREQDSQAKLIKMKSGIMQDLLSGTHAVTHA